MEQALLIAAILIGSLAAALTLVARSRIGGVTMGLAALVTTIFLVGRLGGAPPSPLPDDGPEAERAWVSATGAPRTFDPTTIHAEINGAADLFIRHGLVAATFRTYRVGDVELTLELYDLGAPAGPRAVFAEQVAPDRARTAGLGDEGAADDLGVDARAGRLYLRITHNEPEPSDLSAPMTALARAALASAGAPDVITSPELTASPRSVAPPTSISPEDEP